MKQQLWILNSSLLCMLILATIASYMLFQQAPPFRKSTIPQSEPETVRPHLALKLDLFTQNDIFGTTAAQTYPAPVKQSLVTEIPKLIIPQIPLPPEPAKTEFIPPLAITLNGIVIGSDELLSIAMIVDETGKEGMYHLGDKVKDGTIVRITRNRIVIFRANGQEETFYLRKEQVAPPGATPENRWTYVAKKLEEEGKYQLDTREFAANIESLGELLDMLGAAPIFKQGKVIGIRINKANPTEIAPVLGLEKGDLIESINDIPTSNLDERLKLYESVTNLKDGDKLKITLQRNKQPKTLTYDIGRISRFSKYAFLEKKDEKSNEKSTTQGLPDMFKKTPHQEHMSIKKDFDVRHNQQHADTIEQIRKRLLNNMNSHAPHARIR